MQNAEKLQSAVVEIAGPNGGHLRRLRICINDTPASIEHCIRTLFQIAAETVFLVVDRDGCTVPLGPGLLMPSEPAPEEDVLDEPALRVKLQSARQLSASKCLKSHLRVQNPSRRSVAVPHEAGHLPGVLQCRRSDGAQRVSAHKKRHTVVARTLDERQYWISLARSVLKGSLFDGVEEQPLQNLFTFDTSPKHIDDLFDRWASPDEDSSGLISCDSLQAGLEEDYEIVIDEEDMEEAVTRTWQHLKEPMPDDGPMLSRKALACFWQRLVLGILCIEKEDNIRPVQDMLLISFNRDLIEHDQLSDPELFFRTRVPNEVTNWVRADCAGPERLARFGVKFFLHPTTTEDAINAAQVGLTRCDRHCHQLFISMETYSMMTNKGMPIISRRATGRSTSGSFGKVESIDADRAVPPRVGTSVVRSTMFLVATGNPVVGYRDWLLSMVNVDRDASADPCDFFQSDPESSVQVLDAVQYELRKKGGKLRENRADMLMYAIIDKAVGQVFPICLAYGHRLRWLQRRLDAEKLQLPSVYVEEVARVRLELQELRQWIGQMRGVLKHLESDSNATDGWSFGAEGGSREGGLVLYLHITQDRLEQIADRIVVLDEVVRGFVECHERHRDAFMNQTLLSLTVASAVFMPAQLVTGIYGTNFVRGDGLPTSEEARWEYGYVYLWTLCGSLILLGLLVAYCVLIRTKRGKRHVEDEFGS